MKGLVEAFWQATGECTFRYDTSRTADGNGNYGWEKHLTEHQRIGAAIQGLTEHAELVDRRIEALREAQSEMKAGVMDLVGAIRDLIDRIPPENLH